MFCDTNYKITACNFHVACNRRCDPFKIPIYHFNILKNKLYIFINFVFYLYSFHSLGYKRSLFVHLSDGRIGFVSNVSSRNTNTKSQNWDVYKKITILPMLHPVRPIYEQCVLTFTEYFCVFIIVLFLSSQL